MKPSKEFQNKEATFWAIVKIVSEQIGYSERAKKGERKTMKRYEWKNIFEVLQKENPDQKFTKDNEEEIDEVLKYLNFRSDVCENKIKPKLMSRDKAKDIYEKVLKKTGSKRAASMNKQKGEKKHPAYLTNIVSLLAENVLGEDGFVDDARRLSFINNSRGIQYAFSRRFDGALPTTVNPKAVWEVKEYYGTKTFGSRVADGIYETMLDGFEINDVERICGHRVKHFLFVDDYFTWWECGRSYLCRIVDVLNSGFVDEVFFGEEIISDWEKALSSLK